MLEVTLFFQGFGIFLKLYFVYRETYKPEHRAEDEDEFIRDVEAATGANLRGKEKRGKRKRKEDTDGNAPVAVRNRLNVISCIYHHFFMRCEEHLQLEPNQLVEVLGAKFDPH